MIGLESPVIKINTTTNELIEFLGNPKNSSFIYQHKVIRQFQPEIDGFTFIIKRASIFNFKLKKTNQEEIKFVSKKDMPFESVLAFKFHEAGEISVAFQSDTTPFMDFMIEKKVDQWLNFMLTEIKNHFN